MYSRVSPLMAKEEEEEEVLKVYRFRDIDLYIFCNVFRICNIRAIPTYKVYRLHDKRSSLNLPPSTSLYTPQVPSVL